MYLSPHDASLGYLPQQLCHHFVTAEYCACTASLAVAAAAVVLSQDVLYGMLYGLTAGESAVHCSSAVTACQAPGVV